MTNNAEKRRAKRRPVLDTFSVFVTVPKKGDHRLPAHDVSELGIGFDLDIEGEPESELKPKSGDILDVHFYLNQSLAIPLKIRVARVEEKGSVRRVGGAFAENESKAYQAFSSFIKTLDLLVDVAQLDKS